MNYDTLIEQYLGGPGLPRRAIAGMTRDQLLARPIPGRCPPRKSYATLLTMSRVYASLRNFRSPALQSGQEVTAKPGLLPWTF